MTFRWPMAGGAGRRKSKRQNTEEEGSAGEGGRGEIAEWRATLVYFRGLISESQGHRCNCSHMEMLPTVEARHAPQLTDASTRKRVEDLKTGVAARLSSLYGPPQISPSTAPETQPVEPAIPVLGCQNWNSVGYPDTITHGGRAISPVYARTQPRDLIIYQLACCGFWCPAPQKNWPAYLPESSLGLIFPTTGKRSGWR